MTYRKGILFFFFSFQITSFLFFFNFINQSFYFLLLLQLPLLENILIYINKNWNLLSPPNFNQSILATTTFFFLLRFFLFFSGCNCFTPCLLNFFYFLKRVFHLLFLEQNLSITSFLSYWYQVVINWLNIFNLIFIIRRRELLSLNLQKQIKLWETKPKKKNDSFFCLFVFLFPNNFPKIFNFLVNIFVCVLVVYDARVCVVLPLLINLVWH